MSYKDKEQEREYMARYYAEHKEHLAKHNAEYYAEHKEQLAKQKAEYYAEHKEQIAKRDAEYNAAHPEKNAFYRNRRRSRKLNASGNDYITSELIESRWNYYGRTCYLCGEPATATDHVIPLAKGGSQYPANLRPICTSCNSSKRDKWPYDFNAHRERVLAANQGRDIDSGDDNCAAGLSPVGASQ